MHLDELHSVDDLKVRHHLIRHLAGTDSVQRELHSQEIIGIASEGLPVEKFPQRPMIWPRTMPQLAVSPRSPKGIFFFRLK